MNAKTLFAALAATSMFAVSGAVTTPEVGFEGFSYGDTVGGRTDAGSMSDIQETYFLFKGESDSSAVSNTADTVSYSGTDYPGAFAGLGGKYLKLDTEGGTLFRSVNHLQDTQTLGTGESFNSAPIYIDTLVQFTTTEDDTVDTESNDKLAIYLNTNGNLCVKAGYLKKDNGGNETTESTDYETTTEVTPNVWYRLTVQAIGGVGGTSYPGFKIYVNETLVVTTNATASDAMGNVDDMKADGDWAVFPSLVDDTNLNAVGFKGTGAVDDLVITADTPAFLVHTFDFTLTWTENVTSIKYILDGVETTTNVVGAGSISLNGNILEIKTNNVVTTGGTADWTTSFVNIDPTYNTDPETYEDYVDGYKYTIIANGATINLAYTGLTPPTPAGFNFTLAWMENVRSIKYILDGVETTTNVVGAGAISLNGNILEIKKNDVVTTGGTANWTTSGSVNIEDDYKYTILANGATINLAYTLTPAGWEVDPDTAITAGDKASDHYAGLADSALANADAQALTKWAKANGITFEAVANDKTGTYVDAYLLNCDPDDVDDETEAFTLDITFDTEGNPVVSLPTGKTYNVDPQLKASNDLATWTNVEKASTIYKFYKCVLELPAAE